MFFSPGLEQLDPALLAFVKCHVTSPVKWEVLRVLASQDGAWIRAVQLARSTHRPPSELTEALADLAADGVVEALAAGAPEDVSYRLPADEPTSIVLHRLIDAATHSLELRAIIAAHMQHVRQQGLSLRTTAAA
jgi:DNA-binding IclR family transcriptional regulator